MMHDGAEDEDARRDEIRNGLDDETIRVQVKEKVLTPTFALLCLAVLMSSLGALGVFLDNREERDLTEEVKVISEDTNELVRDIEERNSPEAIEERTQAINDIILEVACRDRETLEEFSAQLFGELIASGVLPEGTSVTLQPAEECATR